VPNLKTILKNRLRGLDKIAVLGVGSALRADDIAGILAARELEKSRLKSARQPKLKVFLGDTAPENLTGEIKKFKPAHLIIIDAADTKKKAGSIVLIDPKRTGGISFCTHQLPMKIITEYLAKSLNCKITLIGIQPKRLDFCASASKEVVQAAKDIAHTICEALKT